MLPLLEKDTEGEIWLWHPEALQLSQATALSSVLSTDAILCHCQAFTPKPPNNALPHASLVCAQTFHQYPPQYFKDEVQASKDVIQDAIYYKKLVWVLFYTDSSR